ncbi:MAG: signal peptidase II, partial [Oscillospiraceae bacterium]|nr:signal peptidase II [Oscillospiraceae bacterium]
MIYAIVGLLFLLADQFLKFWTVAHVELNAYPGIELIPGVLNLTYIKNTGIAFGLFGDKPMLRWILLALLAAFTVFIVASMATRYLRTGFARWTGVLLLTGLLGNGVDRAVYGYVVDMLEPKLGSISWPIFNIADALILVFGILFCVALLSGGFGAPKRKRRKAPLRRDDRAPARKPRPEAARGASSGKPRRPHEGARPARRSE